MAIQRRRGSLASLGCTCMTNKRERPKNENTQIHELGVASPRRIRKSNRRPRKRKVEGSAHDRSRYKTKAESAGEMLLHVLDRVFSGRDRCITGVTLRLCLLISILSVSCQTCIEATPPWLFDSSTGERNSYSGCHV